MLHHFKESDTEIAFVDLRYVTGATLEIHCATITLNISGTSQMNVSYQKSENCSLEYLRLTTAIQALADNQREQMNIVFQSLGD